MHWVDAVAKALLEKGSTHVVASGTSISGQIHIGNAGDVIIADGICRTVRESGGSARLLWIMDDMDPLRGIPTQIPREFSKFLGFPDHSIPCPTDHCSSFIEHFTTPFIDSLEEVGIVPEIISSAELYESGQMAPYVEKALERADDIKRILEEVSGSEKGDDWLPFDPVCSSCGKITPTKAYDYDPDRKVVKYRCVGGVAGKKPIEGCGHEAEAALTEGKLTWRVDWAARWSLLGVTCEPFGKEHGAAGGSYDTSSRICREIFGNDPPKPVMYEFILVGGKKMSKSIGNLITLGEMSEAGTPELSRFFFFRTKASAHKELKMEKTVPQLMDNYEWCERVYFGQEESFPEKELDEIRRNYELSQIEAPPDDYFQIPFSHLLMVVQLAENRDSILNILSRTGTHEPKGEHSIRFDEKAHAARAFLERYGTDNMLFSLITEPADLEEQDISFVKAYYEGLEDLAWTPESLHQHIYSAAEKVDQKAGPIFRAMYRALLGKDRGPRLGYFLASLDRDFVVALLGKY